MGPLTGIRVLDFSRAIAGPYGSMILGDLGAEIIKIETPEGDFSRVSAGPAHKGENFYYLAFNRNKKDLVLDLLTKPKELEKAWEELEKRKGGREYKSPLPPELKPPLQQLPKMDLSS